MRLRIPAFQGDLLATQLVSAVEGHRQECHLNKFVEFVVLK